MPLILRWRGGMPGPVAGEGLRPDCLPAAASDLAHRPIRVGNEDALLGDLFELVSDGNDQHLILEGDFRSVHGLGAGMKAGRLEVRGDVGHRLGAEMAGGSIAVFGSAGAATGADLAGGIIRVEGNTGPDLGAAQPGSRIGARGGLILVKGDAGPGVGTAIRRGLIAVGGSVGSGAGRGMIAGTIFVGGAVGPSLGAGMKRGTIAVFGGDFEPAPAFEPSGSLRPPVAAIYLRRLREWGWPVPTLAGSSGFRRYNGDRTIGGQGEIWQFG